jgi:hypothetical protein
MTASPSLHRTMLAAACVFALVGAAGASQTIENVDRESALRLFHERVEDYAALHRRLEGPLPALKTTRNMLKNYIAQQLLANAIRKTRRDVQQGIIFSPDVAAVFRALISDALAGRDVEAFLTELQSEHPGTHDVLPVINEPLPAEATHEMPVVILRILPALPDDVEYRIVNHDLVLWDIHADLVIDYVRSAFRPLETTLLQ